MKNEKRFNDANKGCYMGGLHVPYIPNKNDCWSNPLDEYKNFREKSSALLTARYNNVHALDNHGNKYPVKNYTVNQLAFVAGNWRVQSSLLEPIIHVRDKDMMVLKKLDRVENTYFEFYSAKIVGYNCYGPIVSAGDNPDYIVAKYETDSGVFLGYGKTIEEARAYLGVKLYDEYKDLINSVACKKKLNAK